MTSYHWGSPISKLREDRIISIVLEQGLASYGFETLGDLKTGKDKPGSKYLKRQVAYLCDFLQVAIDCDSHNCNKEELIRRLPFSLVKSTEYVFLKVCKDTTSKLIIDKVFITPKDLLYALLVDKATIFKPSYYHFISKSGFNIYRNAVFKIVHGLLFFCECFPDCHYYGKHLDNIVVEAIGHYEAEDVRMGQGQMQGLIQNNIDKTAGKDTLSKLFNNILSHYALRTRNTLGRNGITSINDFKPWIEDIDKDFLSLKGCGRKSAMELELFRKELLTALQQIGNSGYHSGIEDMNLLEKALDTWRDGNARLYILEVFGSSRAFVTSFALSAQKTFSKLQKNAKDQFDLFTAIIELVASVIVSNQNEEQPSSIVGSFKSFEKMFKANRQKMLTDSLMTVDKKKLVLAEFNRKAMTLSIRSRNVLFRIVNAENPDSIAAFLNSEHLFTSLSKIGEKSDMELKVFTNQMTGYFARMLFKDDDAAKYAAIIEDFPFLNTVDAKFIYDYKASKGHYPMFFVSWRYFSDCVNKADKLYRDYYGMGFTDSTNLDKLANEYHLSRERARQIVSIPQNEAHYRKNPLLREQQWKAYPFVYDDIVTERSSDFESLASEEHLEMSFFAFCGIVNYISPKIIEKVTEDNGKLKIVAYTTWLRGFKLHSALREIVRLRDINKDTDISISLYDHFSKDEKYWPKNAYPENSKITLSFRLLSRIIIDLHIANIEKDGNLLFKANKTNYSNIICGILKEHGRPMHIREILTAFKEKLPEDHHDTAAALKYFIMRDDRIEPIGRTSTYKLTSWEDYSGSIPKLLVDLLLAHNSPVEISKLVEEALKFRMTSTKRSIESNINQKVADATLVMYYPNLVGLNGKSYDNKYKIVPKSFDEYLNAYVDFVENHKRFPILANSGYESMLYRWHSDAKALISLNDHEIIKFSEAMHTLETKHYAHGKTEFNFLIKCDQYKQFVLATGRVLTDEDDKPLASWFVKSAMNYLSWNDNRTYYFKDLLQFISKAIE